VVIYGAPVVDPVQLLSHMKQPLAVCVSLFGEWGCSCAAQGVYIKQWKKDKQWQPHEAATGSLSVTLW
jgi:hypothetical protein